MWNDWGKEGLAVCGDTLKLAVVSIDKLGRE